MSVISETKTENLILETPVKTTRENYFIMSAITAFIIVFGAFWKIETILWNRIKYRTGEHSNWANTLPKYSSGQNWSLNAVTNVLSIGFIVYIIGIIILICVSGYIFYLLTIKRVWSKKAKILTILSTIYSGLSSIIGYWVFQSIKVIASLPSWELDQTGYEWIREDLVNIAPFIEYSSQFVFIFFSIFAIFSISMLIRNAIQSRRRRKNPIQKERKMSMVFKGFTLQLMKSLPFYLILSVYLVFTLFPVIVVIKVSLSTPTEIFNGANPGSPLYSLILNYSSVMFAVSMKEQSFSGAIINSVGIGLGTGLLALLVSVTSAYALARFKFRGNKFLTFLILSTQMFPAIILLLPQYLIWVSLGLVEKLGGLLLASATGAVAYCTWMMKGYFETIPIDIEEAATIDGSSPIGNFARIAFPLARSGLVAVLLFTFISAWQDFVLARTFIVRTLKNYTLTLLFQNYENSTTYDALPFFELLAPYAILVALPIVLFFMFMQKDLAKGAVAGSVK